MSSLTDYKLLHDQLHKKNFPIPNVIWLEGEEDFFIDEMVYFIEDTCIPQEHKIFHQHILFGQSTDISTIVATAKQAPMNYEKQLIVVKEAQYLNSLDQLLSYVENPSPFSLLVVAYKNKKLDKRSSLYKQIKQSFTYVSFAPLYPKDIAAWIAWRAAYHEIKFSQKAVDILIQHVGNRLSLLDSELKKLAVNFKGKLINEGDIFRFIGVSKEYNIFEWQSAFVTHNIKKIYDIVHYFEHNKKENPTQVLLLTMHTFFSKIYMLYTNSNWTKDEAAAAIGISPYFVEEYLRLRRRYSLDEICFCLQTINHYYKKLLGIDASVAEQNGLLYELTHRLLHAKEIARLAHSKEGTVLLDS